MKLERVLKRITLAYFGLIIALVGCFALDGCNQFVALGIMVFGGLFVIPYIVEFNREMKRRDKK